MGGIDPNIVLRLQQPQFERPRIQTPLEQFQKILTLKQLMQEGQLGELALQAKQEELDAYKGMGTLFPKPALTTATPAIGLQPPAAAQPIPPDAYQEPNLMRPAGPEGRTPVTTTAFAPAGTPSVSSGLSGFPSAEALIAKGGRFAFPLIENLNKARKAELDQHISALDLAKKEGDAAARLANGITDDASLRENLPIAANKKWITWDDARRYSELGFANPATQAWLKKKQLESLDYVQNVEVAGKNAQQERDKIKFEDEQKDQERQRFAQKISQLTDVKDIPAALAEESPYIQKFYGNLTSAKNLDEAKQRAALGAVKPEIGKTVAEPEAVQAGKVAVSAAQGLAAEQVKLALQRDDNKALLELVLKDKTGSILAGLPESKQNQLGPDLARAGYTTFGVKAPTSTEQRAMNFWERGRNAQDILSTLDPAMQKKGTIGQGAFEILPNVMQSEFNQKYEQAERQFIEAYLRKDSGAVIGPSEYQNARKTFFPQAGDGPTIQQQKAAARETVLNAMRTEAGNAYRQKYGEPEAPKAEGATPSGAGARTGAAVAAPPGSFPVKVTKPGEKPKDMWMGPDGKTYDLPPEPQIPLDGRTTTKTGGGTGSAGSATHRFNPKTGKIEVIR